MPAQEYSKRLGVISPAQFQAALDRFDLGGFTQAEPILYGLFGQNVFLTSSRGEYVLRGDPHFPWQFPTERFFAHLLHERTQVPVPFPYLIDPTGDIFGWSYVIMPRLPGLQLADPAVTKTLNEIDTLEIARAMGENLASMQELTWDFSGRYDPTTDSVRHFELQQELAWPFPVHQDGYTPTTVSNAERIVAKMRDLLASSCSYNMHTTASDAQWVEEVIAGAGDALAQPFQPCFVMEDYKIQNAVVERIDDQWRVSGIFDLMEAHFGDGEADLSRQLAMYLDEDHALAGAFLQAYCEKRLPRPGFAQRFPIYMLFDRLIIWEYFQRNGNTPWNRQLSLREWAEPYATCLSTVRF